MRQKTKNKLDHKKSLAPFSLFVTDIFEKYEMIIKYHMFQCVCLYAKLYMKIWVWGVDKG
jgi:hypothetical protein